MDEKTIETTLLSVSLLECNEGQIPDVPSNPRLISEERLEALKRSIEELPDMLSMRELLVYPQDDKYIVLGGNQRLVVCKELGYEKVPCKIIPKETTADILRRIVMVDNEEFGKTDWDAVQSEWDVSDLRGWGVEIPSFINDDFNLDSFFGENAENEEEGKAVKIEVVCPKDYTEEQVESVRAAIEESLTEFEGVAVK